MWMRYRKCFFGVVFLSSFCNAFVCAQDVYRIDPNQSTIGFSVKHMLINTVHGKFTDYSGAILLNESDLTKSSADLKINTASINTEVTPRDNDLRSPNFLDVAKYPNIIFTSHRVEKNVNGYVLVGELAMHGVSKEVTIPFKYNGKVKDLLGNTRIGFEGGLTINRQEWGITYSKVLDSGGLVAGNEVKIELDIEAVRK
jgi:polyisoprenoid-binding protein YceI